jgi:hypothetical protein
VGSKWSENAIRYGLVNFYSYYLHQQGVRPVLYARILDTDLLLTNFPLQGISFPATALRIVGPDRVDFDLLSIDVPNRFINFPYGWEVEPNL